jgi:hypothetical protein
MVFNEMYIFGVDQKSKMTATTVHLSCSGGHLGYLIVNTKYCMRTWSCNKHLPGIQKGRYFEIYNVQAHPILTSFVLYGVMVSEKNIGN